MPKTVGEINSPLARDASCVFIADHGAAAAKDVAAVSEVDNNAVITRFFMKTSVEALRSLASFDIRDRDRIATFEAKISGCGAAVRDCQPAPARSG